MIEQLPASLHSLVEHVEVLASERIIMNLLSEQQPIRLASDGSAIPGRASYGWILQIGAIPIAKGKGPAHGALPTPTIGPSNVTL
jgi:hypothetical protein